MAAITIGPGRPYAHESIAVDATAGGKALTAATYNATLIANGQVTNRRPVRALITVEDQSLRWTVDGTTVSSTVGHLAAATSDPFMLEGYDAITQFRAIRATGTSSNIRVTYFRND